MDQNVEVSIISPVFNESENIETFVTRVFQTMRESGLSWELIIVDDGSTDGSSDALKRLSQERSELRVLV